MACEILHMACEILHMACEILHMACEILHMACEILHMACEILHMGFVVSHVLVPTVATDVMNTVGGAASVAAVILAGPLIPLMTNMASAVLAVSACEAGSDVLSFPQALIPGVRVGSDDAAASRGVTLVNTVLTVAIIGAFFAAGCVTAVVGGRKRANQISRFLGVCRRTVAI